MEKYRKRPQDEEVSLRPEQVRAIDTARTLAARLPTEVQERFVTLFRAGDAYKTIAQTCIPQECEKSLAVAIRMVGFVIAELMDEDERREIARRHQEEGLRLGAQRSPPIRRARGERLFPMDFQDRSALSRRIGKDNVRLGRGPFQEGWRDTAAGKASTARLLESTGRISLSPEEIAYTLMLAVDPTYRVKGRSYPDYEMIAVKVNEKFGNNRTRAGIKGTVHRFKKRE